MPVQMFALTVVVGDAVTGIEFQAAGDLHDVRVNKSGADYSLKPRNLLAFTDKDIGRFKKYIGLDIDLLAY